MSRAAAERLRWVILGLTVACILGYFWRRSFGGCEAVVFYLADGRASGVVSAAGRVTVVASNLRGDAYKAWSSEALAIDDKELQRLRAALDAQASWHGERVGFAAWWRRPDPEHLTGVWFVAADVPYSALVGGCAGLMLIPLARAWRTGRRHRRGLCRNCGYDLRASGDRCPECGTERGEVHGDVARGTTLAVDGAADLIRRSPDAGD